MARVDQRVAQRKPGERPLGLSILSASGVVLGLVIGALTVALAAAQGLAGGALIGAAIVGVAGLVLALTIVWTYWGLWEMLRSAWWSHMLAGPVAVLGLALLVGLAPDTLTAAASLAPQPVRELAERAAIGGTALLIAIECAVVGYLPMVRGVFGIGAPKQAWER